MLARFLCMHGDPDQGLAYLDQAIRGGYWCYPAFVRDPWLDPVRDRPEFARILKRAGGAEPRGPRRYSPTREGIGCSAWHGADPTPAPASTSALKTTRLGPLGCAPLRDPRRPVPEKAGKLLA